MNRRQSLKAIGITSLSAGMLLDACTTKPKEKGALVDGEARPDRQPLEVDRDNRLDAETFFNPHELATITVLSDLILPRDERSGSASDAGVPEFIEFMAKDRPEHQVPLRGGLRWLDMQCLNRYGATFRDCPLQQQTALLDEIAYPDRAKPAMQQGVAFFDRMRNLTATGFFTSRMGVEDLGYVGNRPNQWEGVPADVLRQYGLEDVRF